MIKTYFDNLARASAGIVVTNRRGELIGLDAAALAIAASMRPLVESARKVMLIGNGGSAGIASHIAVDLLKNAGIPAMTFTDASSLTCIGNDIGYEAVFQKPVEMFSQPDDILIAISSSGKSKNILSAVLVAQEAGCFIVTLSGFDADNPLRAMGDIIVHVPSHSYGVVEITHLAVCHCVVDALVPHG